MKVIVKNPETVIELSLNDNERRILATIAQMNITVPRAASLSPADAELAESLLSDLYTALKK